MSGLWTLVRAYPFYSVLTLLLIIGMVLLEIRFKLTKKSKRKDGSVHYLKPDKAEGIIFGWRGKQLVCSPTDEEGHTVVFGMTGSAKTSALLIPTLRKWRGNFLAIDISGDICRSVHAPDSIIYDPTDPDTVPYNVFGPIDQIPEKEDKIEALAQMALLMMPPLVKGDDNARFFNDNGRRILQASLIAFYFQEMDFIPICEKIVGSSYPSLFEAIDQTQEAEAIKLINSFEGASEKNTAGCKQAVDDKLLLFATNSSVRRSCARPAVAELALTPFILEEKSVFVIVPDAKLKLYSPLLSLITAQCLEYLSSRENYPETKILLALDEFSSLGKLEMLDALRKLRKKGVRIMVLTQAMADLDLIYGQTERMAMLNNFAYKVILSAGDTDTQDYLAKLIGNQKVQKVSYTESKLSSSKTTSEAKEFIIEPSDLSHLKDELVLITRDGFLRLRKNYYFKYDNLK